MEQIKQFVEWQRISGEPIAVGETMITPQSQTLSIHFSLGGFVWNRPVGILVKRNGETEEIPIIDVTRTAIIALMVSGVATTFLVWLIRALIGRR